jgi:hypothetical protein
MAKRASTASRAAFSGMNNNVFREVNVMIQNTPTKYLEDKEVKPFGPPLSTAPMVLSLM